MAESFRSGFGSGGDRFRQDRKHARVRVRVRHRRVPRQVRFEHQVHRAGVRDEADRAERVVPAAADLEAVRGRRRQLERDRLQRKVLNMTSIFRDTNPL